MTLDNLASERYDANHCLGINSLNGILKEMGQRGSNGSERGPLAGDPLIRSLQRQLASHTTTAIPGFQDKPVISDRFRRQD